MNTIDSFFTRSGGSPTIPKEQLRSGCAEGQADASALLPPALAGLRSARRMVTVFLCALLLPGLARAADTCDGQPVYMVVAGETLDPARMAAYGRAIQESGLYAELGGYYLNTPRPLAVFEGDVPANYATLIVRFPCLANARAFWYSRTYQEQIKPLRENPAAGNYRVTVYAEGELPAYMQDAVGEADYQRDFDASGVEAQLP